MTATFKFRRGTAARWTEVNPILKDGEPGVELDSGKMKIGNGTLRWNDLDYFLPEAWIQEMIDQIVATGVPGPQGPAGASAYEIAVNGGFIGTEAEWLLSLEGTDGAQGIQGPPGADGADGSDGAQGIQGIPGTPGSDGATGPQGPKGDKGDTGDTGPQGIQGPKGDTGATGATGPAGTSYTGPKITANATAPSSPASGDVWIDLSS